MIGYDTTNYIQAMQSILLAIAMVILKVLYICILQIKICIYEDNEDYKESKKQAINSLIYGDIIAITLEAFIEFMICGQHQL